MRKFAHHASHCSMCAHPYAVHMQGGTLCPRGHQHAILVTEYVLNKAGKAYSMVDLEGNQRVQLEIPADCDAVRELLRALERGLRLRRNTPAISYDTTYPVGPRVLPADYEQNQPRRATVQPSTPMVRKGSMATRGERVYQGRGSLYEADMKERERRYKQRHVRETYHNVGHRGTHADDYYY